MIVLTLVSSISTLFLDERSDLQRLQKLQSQVSEMEESLERIPTEVSEDLGIRTELIEMHEQINRLIAKEKKKTRSLGGDIPLRLLSICPHPLLQKLPHNQTGNG